MSRWHCMVSLRMLRKAGMLISDHTRSKRKEEVCRKYPYGHKGDWTQLLLTHPIYVGSACTIVCMLDIPT